MLNKQEKNIFGYYENIVFLICRRHFKKGKESLV